MKKNPIPRDLSLEESHEWLKPLLLEEKKFMENGTGFSLLPCDEI